MREDMGNKIRCPYCGCIISQDRQVCPYCGTRLKRMTPPNPEPVPAAVTQTAMRAPKASWEKRMLQEMRRADSMRLLMVGFLAGIFTLNLLILIVLLLK